MALTLFRQACESGVAQMSAGIWPTGETKVYSVIGDPIDHSLSPALLNAAFKAAAVDAVFVALRVSKEGLKGAISGVRSMGIAGLSVTMPHKETIIEHLDMVTDRVRKLNSANCIYWADGKLVGDSTDGPALVASLEEVRKEKIAGSSVMLLGTGGAARAIAVSLVEANAGEIVVVGRREDAVSRVVALGSPVARPGTVSDAPDCEVIINATNVGMSQTEGEGLTPVPAEILSARHFVCDIVYHPLTTRFLMEAEAVGATTCNGIGMLVHQAAKAFNIWTGLDAPLEAMFDAARLGPVEQ